MKKKSFLIIAALLFISILLAACQPKGETVTEAETDSDKKAEVSEHPLAGKKVALILQQNLGTFSAQYIAGVEEQVENFGGSVTVSIRKAIWRKWHPIWTPPLTRERMRS